MSDQDFDARITELSIEQLIAERNETRQLFVQCGDIFNHTVQEHDGKVTVVVHGF